MGQRSPNQMTQTYARPAATTRSRTRMPGRRRRSLDSDGGRPLIWPDLMADIGGTVQGTRYVTRGGMPFPQREPPVRESVRVGGGKCRCRPGIKRPQRKLWILDVRTDSCASACRCILVRRPDKRETVSLAYQLLLQLCSQSSI